jgi:hypothetical protein
MSYKKDNRTWFRARDNSVDNYPGIGLKGITGDQACIAGPSEFSSLCGS